MSRWKKEQSFSTRCTESARGPVSCKLSALTRLWAHMPSQSRQWRQMRLCSQMPAPPHSLQVYLTLLCSQMLAHPRSLQALLGRLCLQMLAPPQSLQVLLWRL